MRWLKSSLLTRRHVTCYLFKLGYFSYTDRAWLQFCMVNHKEVDDCFWIIVEWFEEFGNPYLSIFSKDLQHVERNSRTTSQTRLTKPRPGIANIILFRFDYITRYTNNVSKIQTLCLKFSMPILPFLFFGDSRNLHFKSHNFRINFDGDMAQFTLVSWI